MITSVTAGRTLGALPLSIGTSIAFESVFGMTTEVFPTPKPKVIQDYGEIWINLKTLFRNLYGAVERTRVQDLTNFEMTDALHHEMSIIVEQVDAYSNAATKVVFYVSNYKDLERKYGVAQIRTDRTPNQLRHAELEKKTLHGILMKGQIPGSQIKIFDLKLKSTGMVKTLIITHIPYDLVSYNEFGSLTLLESHTGALKGRDKWYTKYFNGKELSNIPFVEGLLPVFGDNELFRPMNKAARDDIIELARKYHWSAVTTREKILYGVGTLKNHYLKESIISFFH